MSDLSSAARTYSEKEKKWAKFVDVMIVATMPRVPVVLAGVGATSMDPPAPPPGPPWLRG